jgi:hypothetical protein
MSVTTIATGAPKYAHDEESIGYFYSLPITSSTIPTDAFTAPTGTPIDGGFVGDEGPTLTCELDSETKKDWNLDPVIQVLQGADATLEIPVFGWNEEQAGVIYGEDSVVETANGFKVAWAGELSERRFWFLELAGVNGNGRLIVDGQVKNPGSVQFNKGDALTHTVTLQLFKNAKFKDAKSRSSFFVWYDETKPVTP